MDIENSTITCFVLFLSLKLLKSVNHLQSETDVFCAKCACDICFVTDSRLKRQKVIPIEQ